VTAVCAGTVVDHAEHIARYAHRGQVDKGGLPYEWHLERVAERVYGDDAKAAAWLHDSIEDTYVTAEILGDLGIPWHIVHTVERLTHLDGMSYQDYIERLAVDSLAVKVKMADLLDNLDPRRLTPRDSAVDISRRQLKHWRALNRLQTGSWPS
jgi:(p)ppGpp synthase/HD superfamily hydrolase